MFRADEPPLLFQVGIELLKVLLSQLAQRDFAQLRDNMLVDGALICVLCGGTEAGLDVGLISKFHLLLCELFGEIFCSYYRHSEPFYIIFNGRSDF